MKKRLSLIAVLVLAGGLIFAKNSGERSVHAIGFDVPITSMSIYDRVNDKDMYTKGSGVGFDFMYHHLKVSENRFSSFINVELGYGSFTPDEREYDGATTSLSGNAAKTYNGLSDRFSFGLGGAPVNTDKVILAIHGTLGVNSLIAFRDYEQSSTLKIDEYMISLWTTAGVNVETAVKLSNHFGLFAGVNFYTNILGFSVIGNETTVKSGSTESTTTDSTGYSIYPGSFNADIRFGIAFIY